MEPSLPHQIAELHEGLPFEHLCIRDIAYLACFATAVVLRMYRTLVSGAMVGDLRPLSNLDHSRFGLEQVSL